MLVLMSGGSVEQIVLSEESTLREPFVFEVELEEFDEGEKFFNFVSF